jgi:hypothetical protein
VKVNALEKHVFTASTKPIFTDCIVIVVSVSLPFCKSTQTFSFTSVWLTRFFKPVIIFFQAHEKTFPLERKKIAKPMKKPDNESRLIDRFRRRDLTPLPYPLRRCASGRAGLPYRLAVRR